MTRDIDPSPDGGRMSDAMIEKLAHGHDPETGASAYLQVMALEIKRTRALILEVWATSERTPDVRSFEMTLVQRDPWQRLVSIVKGYENG